MFIIIPLGGSGVRLKTEKYKEPKALIKIFNKPIIFYLLENLFLKDIDFVKKDKIELRCLVETQSASSVTTYNLTELK